MSPISGFSIGQTVTNGDIVSAFKCGNMGGMRRSKATNSLIIISDHTKGLYDDKWFGDVLHYTGMGKSGDQSLAFQQNKTLAESRTNGVDLYLFEVLKSQEYIYMGQVELAGEPYQEVQKGEDGLSRKVWMFPLRVISGDVTFDRETLAEYEEEKRRRARQLSTEDLKQRAEISQSEDASVRVAKGTTYIRDPYVSEYAKRQANGVCQLCNQRAPFMDSSKQPYLETHHIEWLSKGGSDTIENTVALCPNCHRKMHVLDLKDDKEKLISHSRGAK